MIIIRPVKVSDIEQLLKLATKVAPGITTFPPNRAILEQKIVDSIQGFQRIPSSDTSTDYLMVMEDTEREIIMGTAAVYANIGRNKPFYTYKILERTQHSYEIGAKVESQTLHLVNDYAGDTEIGTLILDPGYRGGGYGKLLSKCRYMLIAQFQERFAERIFAELRGWSDENFKSPFWDAVGKHFYNGMTYEKADYLSATTDNQFIADLAPNHPIYIDVLPQSAKDVVGKPHPTGEPALKMLFNEGFRYENYVDIFDAGPTVHALKCDVATIVESNLCDVNQLDTVEASSNKYLVCNTHLEHFRVAQITTNITDNKIDISNKTAKDLRLTVGEQLRVYKL